VRVPKTNTFEERKEKWTCDIHKDTVSTFHSLLAPERWVADSELRHTAGTRRQPPGHHQPEREDVRHLSPLILYPQPAQGYRTAWIHLCTFTQDSAGNGTVRDLGEPSYQIADVKQSLWNLSAESFSTHQGSAFFQAFCSRGHFICSQSLFGEYLAWITK
jgi:hypothetical protein